MAARFSQLATGAMALEVEHDFDEAGLVLEAARGNRAAFGELYKRYARMVHGILLSRVPIADAEDLTQDVFISAFGKLGGLREHAAFPGWLAAIARNRAVEFHRAWHRDANLRLQSAKTLSLPASDDSVFILETIRALPEAYRETLILRLVEGMTGPEIAAKTGLTPDSVRVNLFRGMKMLRERLVRKEAQ